MRILEIVLLVTLLSAVLFPPNSSATRTVSFQNTVINNLRQIDGAKDQWALEKRHPGSVKVTLEDLAPYLRGGLVQPVRGEKYLLTTVEEAPQAILTRKVDGYPIGTLVKLDEPWMVLPPNTYRDIQTGITKERLLLCSLICLFAIGAGVFLVKKVRSLEILLFQEPLGG